MKAALQKAYDNKRKTRSNLYFMRNKPEEVMPVGCLIWNVKKYNLVSGPSPLCYQLQVINK